ARDLSTQGLQGGAFYQASTAALLMQATTETFDTLQDLLFGDINAFIQSLAASETAFTEFEAFLGTLGTASPTSITDAEALTAAYGNAFDAYSLLLFASAQIDVIAQRVEAGEYTDVTLAAQDSLQPLIYLELARGQLEFARSVYEVARDAAGAPIADTADLEAVASFLRRGAEANWSAFEAGVIAPNADRLGVSNDVFRSQISAVDLDIALAYAAVQARPSIESYVAQASQNSHYAAAGFGSVNYARNAVLLEKYFNNGILDDQLQIVGVTSDAALTTALELGRTQLARSISVLEQRETESVLAVGSYELGGVLREGEVVDKFNALAQYSSAFTLTRAMAYLGGFPTEGWGR
ncbi:MAG: hypothetical protein ACXIUP_03565, partial [Microcella sp.]